MLTLGVDMEDDMDEKLNALGKLIKAVEGEREMSCNDFAECGIPQGLTIWRLVYKAYNGSLDAALALHKTLLPGWDWEVTDGFVFLECRGYWSNATAQTPARSWLIAILKAYRSIQ